MQQRIKHLLHYSLVRFGFVGALGFAINFALLTLLYRELGTALFVAQLIAGEIALFSNFMLHHYWTYRGANVEKTIIRLVIEFHVTSWVAVIGTAAVVDGAVHYAHLDYIVALCVGAVVALVWNYVWSRFVIWRHGNAELTPEAVEEMI